MRAEILDKFEYAVRFLDAGLQVNPNCETYDLPYPV